MNRVSGFVSLHPYFKVLADKLEMLKDVLPEFVAKTHSETQNLFYRVHDQWRRSVLPGRPTSTLKLAELIRIEEDEPAAELEKLKAPLAHLNPAWFVLHRC